MWCGPEPGRNSGAGPLARRANPASTTIAIPLTPAASSRSETSFQAVMTTVVPFPAARARWALVTARTGPKLEIAACCASRSVIPMATPAAAVSRR